MGVAFQPAVMDFAVGKKSAQEAIAAVLDHPAFEPSDKIISYDQLTPTEIFSYRLRTPISASFFMFSQGNVPSMYLCAFALNSP